MLRIAIISVGKKHDSIFEAAVAYYEQKLRSECRLLWSIVSSSNVADEGKQILNKSKNSFVVLLDETGEPYTSTQLAAVLEERRVQSQNDLTLIIGGAYGVSDAVRQRADLVVSLGKLTLPHQLVRVVLLEQLYRGFSILRGTNYHHK